MLLWKDMYPPREKDDSVENPNPWDTWGRPDGGFLDLGCVSLSLHEFVSTGS
jgi:tRNASer (uridine44-2'-O)-methyltransferase